MSGTTDRYPMGTGVSVSIDPDARDMRVVDLGHVDLSGGTHRLVSLALGSVSVLISGDSLDALDRLAAMVTEARVLLTREAVSP